MPLDSFDVGFRTDYRCAMRRVWVLVVICACAAPVASGPSSTDVGSAATTTGPSATSSTVGPTPTSTLPTTTETTIDPFGRPAWLGTIELPVDEAGFGEVRPTPPELIGRAFRTIDLLPPPTGDEFVSTIGPVPPDVLARSTWSDSCPVAPTDLVYVTVSHIGFDGLAHTGELIVNRSASDQIVNVFSQLFDVRYPIEEMRVVAAEELDLAPTGDGNNTTAFVCRPATGNTSWSQHAYGLAIDINPFHNPYLKGELVLPELASYYLNRSLGEPGMILDSDTVSDGFEAIGWGWGGNWTSLKDWMHFSENGR